MAVVYPGPGEEAEVAAALLELAESARDVKVITDTAPGTGTVAFDVPDELADEYNKTDSEDKPKRRGRPRKATADTKLGRGADGVNTGEGTEE